MEKIFTNKIAIELISEIGVPDHDHPDNGGRVPWESVEDYGQWLYENDKVAFYLAKRDLHEVYKNTYK